MLISELVSTRKYSLDSCPVMYEMQPVGRSAMVVVTSGWPRVSRRAWRTTLSSIPTESCVVRTASSFASLLDERPHEVDR